MRYDVGIGGNAPTKGNAMKIAQLADELTGSPIWVAMPDDYDPALITRDDLIADAQLTAFDTEADALTFIED